MALSTINKFFRLQFLYFSYFDGPYLKNAEDFFTKTFACTSGATAQQLKKGAIKTANQKPCKEPYK